MSESTSVTRTDAKAVKVRTPDMIREKLAPLANDLATLLPKVYTPERLTTLLLMAANRSPELLEATTASLAQAVMDVARMGLDLAPGSCYIVVRKVKVSKRGEADRFEKQAQAEPDYRGLMQLARQARIIRSWDVPVVVYEGDRFEQEKGLHPRLEHVPCAAKDRGAILGAYVCYRTADGERAFTFMDVADIEKIRAKSQSWKYGALEPWYAQKCVVRNVCNRFPKQSAALAMALQHDDVDPNAGIDDAEVAEWLDRKPIRSGATEGAIVEGAELVPVDGEPALADPAKRAAARGGAAMPNPYEEAA